MQALPRPAPATELRHLPGGGTPAARLGRASLWTVGSMVAMSVLRDPYAVAPSPIALADGGTVIVRSTEDLGTVDGVSATPMTTTAGARLIADAVAAGVVPAGAAQLVGLGVTA